MKILQKCLARRLGMAAGLLACVTALNAANYFTYVGTYTGPKCKGIHLFKLDTATGVLTPQGLAAEITNPTFMAIHPNQRFLYSISEIGGAKGGGVTAFAIDPATGKLAQLNQQSSGGNGPCHLSVDKTGKCVLVANYGGGSIAALPVKADGSLAEAATFIQHTGSSVNPQRQKGPHAHWIDVYAPPRVDLDAARQWVLACDLGLDKILMYQLDGFKGTLVASDPPFVATKPGAGPRHVAFHPVREFAYAINELDNTVVAYRIDWLKRTLEPIQSLPTLPADFSGNTSTAEVEVHPSGKFVYGSNRGHDSIVVYAVDQATGKLTLVQHQSSLGKSPRNFAVDPTGAWMIVGNQTTGNLVVLKIDSVTGKLSETGQNFEVPGVCVKFVKAN